jgi:TolB-like protein/Flp pilus assembly protein TadD
MAEVHETQMEIGHVLFIDIVGYSKLLINEQSEQIQTLREILRGTEQFRLAEGQGKLMRLPTGDGGALVFRTIPETPVLCALEISKALKGHPELRVRMGIHSGPVNAVTDLNEQPNIAGAGINIAQRVMDCGDAGHILLSKHVAEDLEHYPRWQPYLRDLGEFEVKHGVRVSVVNLYTDDAGNAALPTRLAARKRSSATAKRSAGFRTLLVATVILIGLGVPVTIFTPAILKSLRLSTVRDDAAPSSIPKKSIAVLPFENRSEDKANAYFADGIQDEILSTVAKIGDLKVISRTSTAKYKTRPENLHQVGEELGTATVLEGSVQKVGDRVRVIVQLIDASSDNHIWSETYDRELNDIFNVQSEIAQKVATALQAKLSPADTQSLGEIPTREPEAYQLYLKAGYYQREAMSHNGDPAVLLPQAISLYSEAVAKDPSFALAWAQISYTQSWMHWFGVDDSPERVRLADEAAQQALRLSPQSGEAHFAAGYVAYWGRLDYGTALKEFEIARKLLPNSEPVATAIAVVHRRRGEWDAAAEEFKRAEFLDPRAAHLLADAAYSLGMARRYAEALETTERGLAIQPDFWALLCGRALVQVASDGDVVKADETLASASADQQGQIRFVRYKVAMWSHDFAKAVRILEGAPEWSLINPQHTPVATAVLRGVALEAAGQNDGARREFEAAIPLLEGRTSSGTADPSIHLSLARAYAGRNRKDDAVREGRKAIELVPIAKDAFYGPMYVGEFAAIQARVGNVEDAVALLRQLLDISAGLVVSPALLRIDPAWDPLRAEPRFKKLYQEK